VSGNAPLRNPRHEQFAQLVAAGESASKAYTLAGYPGDGQSQSANRLRKVAKVDARIAYLSRLAEQSKREKAVLSKTWVIAKLTQNVERAMQETEVLDVKGRPTGEFRYDGSVANRALELLGKELGMFREIQELHHFAPVTDLLKSRLARRRPEALQEIEAAPAKVEEGTVQ
jgi:phage terminase small subunit